MHACNTWCAVISVQCCACTGAVHVPVQCMYQCIQVLTVCGFWWHVYRILYIYIQCTVYRIYGISSEALCMRQYTVRMYVLILCRMRVPSEPECPHRMCAIIACMYQCIALQCNACTSAVHSVFCPPTLLLTPGLCCEYLW